MLYCLSRPTSFYYAGLLENGLGTGLQLYRDADELCRERKSKERERGEGEEGGGEGERDEVRRWYEAGRRESHHCRHYCLHNDLHFYPGSRSIGEVLSVLAPDR